MRDLTKSEVFADWDDNYVSCGYETLIDSMEVEVLLGQTLGSYQGDYVAVVLDRSNGKYGFLQYGYGSCSGCDALQACRSMESVQELRDSIFNAIHWEPGPASLAHWFRKRDWEGQWLWHESGFREFAREAVALLEKGRQ